MGMMKLTNSAIKVIAIMALSAVMAAAAVLFWPEPEPPETVATVFPQARELPDVTLIDHHGNPWSRDHLEDGWEIVFFGFTHCPDVCPMTLATLAGALAQLEDNQADVIPEVVFISVDPGRDTPDKLGTYVRHFHDDFTGVSADQATIDQLTRALGIAYSLGEPDANGDYAVDHSAAILLINPEGRLQALWQPPHGRSVIADEFLRIERHYQRTRNG